METEKNRWGIWLLGFLRLTTFWNYFSHRTISPKFDDDSMRVYTFPFSPTENITFWDISVVTLLLQTSGKIFAMRLVMDFEDNPNPSNLLGSSRFAVTPTFYPTLQFSWKSLFTLENMEKESKEWVGDWSNEHLLISAKYPSSLKPPTCQWHLQRDRVREDRGKIGAVKYA